jgi:hypothetical protein
LFFRRQAYIHPIGAGGGFNQNFDASFTLARRKDMIFDGAINLWTKTNFWIKP